LLREVLFGLLWALHVISSVLLIIVVLLQSGRGSGVAGLFGGAAGESPFGAKTGTFLGKVTGSVAAFFFISAIVLAMMSSSSTVTSAVGKSDTPVNYEQEAGKGETIQPETQPGTAEPKAVEPKSKGEESTPKAKPAPEKPRTSESPEGDKKEGACVPLSRGRLPA